jgi:hypothetical protein
MNGLVEAHSCCISMIRQSFYLYVALSCFYRGDQFNYFILIFPSKNMDEQNIATNVCVTKLDKIMQLAKEIEKLSGPIHSREPRNQGA